MSSFKVFRMRGRDSLGTLRRWLALGIGDGAGLQYTGPNTPLQQAYAEGIYTAEGALALSLASKTGTFTPDASLIAQPKLYFTGTPSGDVGVRMPAIEGLCWDVRGLAAASNRLIQLAAVSGTRFVPVLPGAFRKVSVVNGELQAQDQHALVGEVTVALNATSGGFTDIEICRMPAGSQWRPMLVRGAVAASGGGTSSFVVGTSAGSNNLIESTTSPGVGAVVGDDYAKMGTLLKTGGKEGTYVFSADTTIFMRVSATGGAITAGSVVVTPNALWP
jgi:hypothetical protein